VSRRILFVCPRYPYPPLRGDQVRSYRLIAAFADRAEVSVVSFGGEEQELPEREAVAVRTVAASLPGRIAANLAHPSPALPAQVRLFLDAAMRRAVAAEIARLRPHVLHLMLARMGPYLPAAGPIHRHVDLTDSLSLNMATRAGRTKQPLRLAISLEARLMQRYEARLGAAADSFSVVSAADRAVPGLEAAAVVPNGVDVAAFPFSAPLERAPVALFFGNLGYFHNVEPASLLAREVAPLLVAEGAGLRLAGARPARAVRELAELDGVEVAADVASMTTELHHASVALLPSFSGSGIKNKVLESFCAGLPVVSNRLGVQGVEGAVAGTHYLEAETPAEMAAAASRLIADPAARVGLAEAAHELISARYTWDAQADALEAIYDRGRA
jgi:glycosyltransferase involved in cell wall biosynthesis